MCIAQLDAEAHGCHMNTTDADLIGSAEVARILGKSPTTIHRMVNAGALVPAIIAPGGRVGTYLFDRADVEAFTAA